ncbi:MAG: membrane protein insertion efficiency factor YidD [Microgenomates group bacterium]
MLLTLYRRLISPLQHFFGRSLFGSSYSCRFSPTCSVYTAQAVRKYGIIHGSVLGLKRLARCHPLSRSPHLDPVP